MSTQTPQVPHLVESATHATWLHLPDSDRHPIEEHRGSAPAREPSCDFPQCPEPAVTDTGMCRLHDKVTVTGSWVDDKHADKGHG